MNPKIPRDLGSPFNPADAEQRAEFEGFGVDVPNTRGMISAVKGLEPAIDLTTDPPTVNVKTAQSVRAVKLFSRDFLQDLRDLAVVGDFPTPDPVDDPEAIVEFERSGRRKVDILAPNGTAVEMWSFRDDLNPGLLIWPAPTIRVREGDIVHTFMNNSHGAHTIHHHGIEPTPVNDGVGHLTLEVGGPTDDEVNGGLYTYQWLAAEAGTYFYHCHRNTVLHFELGMYGMLIVDPAPPGDVVDDGFPYPDGGPGYTLVGDESTRYDKETFWVVDDIDVRWRSLDKSFGIQDAGLFDPLNPQDPAAFFTTADENRAAGGGGGLNVFTPDFFVVTGVTVENRDNGAVPYGNLIPPPAGGTQAPLYGVVRPVIAPGEKLLIRALNASYCTTVWRFPTTVDGLVTAVDARTLGRKGFGEYSQPFRLSSLPLVGGYRQFTLSTAQRWDILIDQGGQGVHEVLVDFHHWLDYDHLQTAILPITVA